MATGEFFVLLNNDTVVPVRWLDILNAPFLSDEQVALTGASGGCSCLLPSFHGVHGRVAEYIEGSCLMARTDLLRRHGLFSDYLEFAYGEDSDLSLRMRFLGYKIVKTQLRIIHHQSATTRHNPDIPKYQARNHGILVKKWSQYLRTRRVDYPIVIRREAAIGDVLLTTPVIEALHRQKPLCPIHVETAFPELFDRNPAVKQAATAIAPIKDEQRINLDMSYERRLDIPIIEAYAEHLDVGVSDRRLVFNVSDEAMRFAEEKLTGLKPRCVMHTGPTTWTGKNWFRDRWSAITNWLESKGWDVVLVGNGPQLKVPCDDDLRNQLTIDQCAAVMAMSQLFVGLDSFPMHLAMSQGLPVVCLFGATLPQYIFSEGVAIGVHGDPSVAPCIGERHRVHNSTFVQCGGACMKAISTDRVKAAISELIG